MATKSKSHIAVEAGMFAAGAVAAAAGAFFLYGKNAKHNRKIITGWTVKIKGEVLDELERMQGVNQKAYHRLVETVAERYAKLQHINRKDVEKIAKELTSFLNNLHQK